MTEIKSDKKLVFLFDEPASNLHAKAQEKLLESFSEIGRFPNCLLFSTHSHYMIEPIWLEKAYVVKNDAIDYSDAAGEQTRGKRVKIEAISYADFVSQADDKLDRTTYFQPVLDRLDVKPSRLDVQSSCVVLEGKSDYHILTYIKKNYLKSAPALVPAFGATTMRPVIALLRGWAEKYVVVLDDDPKGKEAAASYREDLDLSTEVVMLPEIADGACEIEDVFTEDDLERLRKRSSLSKKPNKKQIRRIFIEANLAGAKLPLTSQTIRKITNILKALEAKL